MINQVDMKSIGDAFKQRRKELNITLKEAENATSIRANYLHSMEEGDVTKLISPIYANGFIKQYALFLGLDGEGIIREYPELFHGSPSQDFSYGIGTLEARGNPGAGVKWFPNAVWVIATAGILTLAWYLAHYLDLL